MVHSRPPIGFIVEGHCEYKCYPSLVAKCVHCTGVRIPIVNAEGYGNIVNRIDEHLTDLCRAHNPLSVIISIDLADVLRQKIYSSCAELKKVLDERVSAWLLAGKHDPRFISLPERVVTVVQILQFESWLISDIQSLRTSGLVRHDTPNVSDADVVENPASWLRGVMAHEADLKRPSTAKQIVGPLNSATMRSNSRSFDKFLREVQASFAHWNARCGAVTK